MEIDTQNDMAPNKVKRIIILIIIWILIPLLVAGLAIFLFHPEYSIYDLLRIPQIRIDFYETTINIEGNMTIFIDIQNIGGVDLHNVKSEMIIECSKGLNDSSIIDYGRYVFQQPSYHLLRQSEPKQIYFKNDELLERISKQKRFESLCSDAHFLIFKYVNEGNEGPKLDLVYYAKYWKNEDKINYSIIYNFTKAIMYLCSHCKYKINIISDEKNFTKVLTRTHILATYEIYDFPMKETDKGRVLYDFWYVDNGEIECVSCLKNRIREEISGLSRLKPFEDNDIFWNCPDGVHKYGECTEGY